MDKTWNLDQCSMQYYALHCSHTTCKCKTTHWCRTQMNDPLEDNSDRNYTSESPLSPWEDLFLWTSHWHKQPTIHFLPTTHFGLLLFLPPMLPVMTLLTVGFGPPLHPWICYSLNIFNKTSTLVFFILAISLNKSAYKSSGNLDWSSMCWMRMTFMVIMGLCKVSSP